MAPIDDSELAARFVSALPNPHPLRAVAQSPRLATALAALCERAAAAHPQLAISFLDLVDFVARATAPGCCDIADLDQLRAADLGLAAACAASDGHALAIVESTVMPQVRAALGRLDHSGGDLTAEVEQAVREKLFVAGKIASYQGRGPLAGFIEVTATREALMLLRRRRREVDLGDGHILDLAHADSDPVLEYARRTYRAAVETALADALAGLDIRDRAVLRYAFVHQMSTAQIGALYNVHKATAFRWLRAARGRLLAALRQGLAATLNIDAADVDSVIRLVESRVELSLERILDSDAET